MKKLMLVTFAITVAFLTGCTTATPDAGHQVVWVEKPIIFGHGGIDSTPVTTGQEYGAITSDAIDVNMLPQRVDMEFDDMMTKSGVPVNFHVVATFQVTDSVMLVSKFGADVKDGNWGFWNRNIDQPIRTAVRDAVKKRDMQEMAISQTAADEVGQEVKEAAIKLVTAQHLPISLMDLNVGRVNPPDAIKSQRVETATQEQRVITEKQRTIAEVQRKTAEQARADADNAYNEKMRLSPDQYVKLEQVKMLHDVCSHNSCTILLGGSASPVYDVSKKHW
jgi:hypothetical protein